VDDEPDLELLISQKFRKRVRDNELCFVFAQNGVEALAKLQSNSEMDIVLTDINMPEMDGLTLLSRLREQHPLLKTVIVSAYGDMANIRTALNRGAFDFITKPIDFQDFEITLNKTIQEAQAFRQAAKDRDRLTAIEQELEVARRIQQSIVPQTFPPFPERKEFDIYGEMITAKDVGGDFYDFFFIDEQRLGFAIGDVSGKGVPAALFMAVSRTLLKSTALGGMTPGDCLEMVNRVLHLESVSAMFVTIFYGILDTGTGEVEYSNGGHNPPYILHGDGRVESTETTGGLVLGALRNSKYKTKKITLRPGDGLFLYTDGVNEAMNLVEEEFTEARLQNSLERAHGSALTEIVQGVVREVKEFAAGASQADDITILALKYVGQ